MNRRAFIKSLLVGVAGSTLLNIDQLLSQSEGMSDGEFIQYVTMQIQLYVSNPSKCAVITNITEPEPPKTPDTKYHFLCPTCDVMMHVNYKPKICIWCGTQKNFGKGLP